MPELLEGSQAVAKAVAMARPGVVCAYPISPQTHIVEALAAMVRTGELRGCEYVNVESEFAAMSVAIGASAAGSRAYTATASQGLLYMTEAVYNAAGLGLPIVMTIANRAIGAPINIWNDQSDSLSQRDSGWLQLFAVDNQDAVDLHVQAYRIAEQMSVPVMVCMDGFVLTHATDVVELPTQEQVDEFLPAFEPRQELDIAEPTTIGMMSGPDTFTEVKYLQHRTLKRAEQVIEDAAADYARITGRPAPGLVHTYGPEGGASDGEAGDLVIVAMGSVIGTLRVVTDRLRSEGQRVRLIGLRSYRPFPEEALRRAVGYAKRVVVIDRAIMPGIGGILSADVRRCLQGGSELRSIVAGLGGRPITERSLTTVLREAADGNLEELTWMDLDTAAIAEEHETTTGRAGTGGPGAAARTAGANAQEAGVK